MEQHDTIQVKVFVNILFETGPPVPGDPSHIVSIGRVVDVFDYFQQHIGWKW
jgi:hypothetical protein